MKNIIFLLAITTIVACKSNKNETATAPIDTNGNTLILSEAQMKNADLIIGKMEQKNIAEQLKLNGKIDVPPQNIVSISVPLGGYLKTTKLLQGMHVRKGEVIAEIEDQQYIQLQEDYLLTKSKLSFSQLEFERQKELNANKASSDKVYQQASTDLQNLKISLNALSQKLKLIGKNPSTITSTNITRTINIYAPIDGFVSAINVNIGKYISPTDVMFELINPTDIHLALKVFEKDVDKLIIGQKLNAFTNNKPDEMHPCSIILIAKNLSSEGVAEVHCHFEDYDKSLIPGTYMNAIVELKNNNSFALPDAAIVNFENKNYCFQETANNQFEMKEIEVGNSENGFTEIVNADKLRSKNIVVKGAYNLLMSLKNKE